jgi:hypothetical protein
MINRKFFSLTTILDHTTHQIIGITFFKKTFYVKTNGALDNYETNIDGVLQLLLQAHVILTTLITNTIKFTYQILLFNFFFTHVTLPLEFVK